MKTGTFIHGRQVFVGSVSIPIPPCPRTIDIGPQLGSGDNFLRGFIFHFQSILPQPARYSRETFAEKVEQPIRFGALRLFFFVSVRRERRGERSKPDRTGPLAEAFPRHNRKNLHRISQPRCRISESNMPFYFFSKTSIAFCSSAFSFSSRKLKVKSARVRSTIPRKRSVCRRNPFVTASG